MTLTSYAPESLMRDARTRYFEVNRFGPKGGYDEPWVNIKLGPVPVSFPNTEGRVRAVRYHDLHHVITGYDTDNVGEFEISAWEIGAGCRNYWAAWFLNLGGVTAGLLRAPRRTFRAFVRGRRSESLYGKSLDELLDTTVAEVRTRMGLDAAEGARANATDGLLFAVTALAGLVTGLALLGFGVLAAPALVLMSLLRAPQRN